MHWSDTRVKEEQPIVHIIRFSRAFWIANEMLGIVLLDKILHDGTRLEKADLSAIRKGVGKAWDSSIRVHFVKKPLLFLSICGDIDALGLVRKTVIACEHQSGGSCSLSLTQAPRV